MFAGRCLNSAIQKKDFSTCFVSRLLLLCLHAGILQDDEAFPNKQQQRESYTCHACAFIHTCCLLAAQQVEDEDRSTRRNVLDQRRFIIVEGLYRNFGDLCPLPELLKLKARAHSSGKAQSLSVWCCYVPLSCPFSRLYILMLYAQFKGGASYSRQRLYKAPSLFWFSSGLPSLLVSVGKLFSSCFLANLHCTLETEAFIASSLVADGNQGVKDCKWSCLHYSCQVTAMLCCALPFHSCTTGALSLSHYRG